MRCPHCKKDIENDQSKWLDIPELKISVEIEVHDKKKSFDDLSLKDREAELLTIEECRFLANHKKYSKILKMEGSSSKDDFFIQQPFDLNRKNGYIARFCSGSYRSGFGCFEYSDYSYWALGVRFKKKMKKSKK